MGKTDDLILVDLLTAGTRHEVLRFGVEIFERRGACYLFEDVITPALREIGRRWEERSLGVADEHLAAAAVEATLGGLVPRFPVSKGGPAALVGCVEGERHQVGARMVADLLLFEGWNAVLLGADVPTEDFVRKARELGPLLVCVSVTMPELLPRVAVLVRGVRGAAPAAKVVVGGRAVAALEDPAELGADAVCDRCSRVLEVGAAWWPERSTPGREPAGPDAATREEWPLVVAHDLRQPVNTILLATSLLLDARSAALEEGDMQVVKRARRAAERLARMVEDLANTALLDSGRLWLRRRHVDVGDVVRAVVEDACAKHEALSVRCVGSGATAWVDPDQVHRVLENLVENATKYGRRGEEIDVETKPSGDVVEVAVTNRGATIPDEQLATMFQKFTRSRAARQSGKPGLGLGLYIARQLVEAHGGRIWVESQPGLTSFHFTLPRGPAPGRGLTPAP